ncbi:MAG: tol-pal system protein YbgF [Deltaproteobacteria bacterium]|jgi:tol-pal system protein YbgF|nr:tol-pal system protein YbgF [Deltaproteobacteria bacterium]
MYNSSSPQFLKRPPKKALQLCLFVILGFTVTVLGGCSSVGLVGRGEFDELEGRVTNLEDIALRERLTEGPGAPSAPFGLGYPTATVGQGQAVQAPKPSGGERTRYNQALSLVRRKRYDQAAAAFRSFLTDFPGSSLAPNARYWLGECHYAKGEFSQAMVEFQRGVVDYPQSAKAPDCLLKLSYSQSRLGDGPGAMESLRVLLERYPGSESAELVRSGRSRFPNGS